MHEFELTADPEEMEPEELRVTISDFMEKHEENIAEYESLEEDHEDLKGEFAEQEEALDELRTKFAEEAAEYINLSPNIIAERFTYSEIAQIVEEGQEADFSEEDDVDDDTDEPDKFTTFPEREEKGKNDNGPAEFSQEARDRAEDALASVGFTTGE